MLNAEILAFNTGIYHMWPQEKIGIINSNRQQGFSLIEALIAMAIFSIGILAVFTMQISAITSNANARHSTTVLTIAKDRVEDLMDLPYEHADLTGSAAPGIVHAPNASEDLVDNDEDGQIDEAGEAGQISVTWTIIDDQPLPGAKSVRVTAVRSVSGRQRTAALDFIVADM